MRLDLSLLHADLGVVYESTGVTDPAGAAHRGDCRAERRAEGAAGAAADLSRPVGLRVKDGKQTPVLELPMAQIP
jgi:hypothetical protein